MNAMQARDARFPPRRNEGGPGGGRRAPQVPDGDGFLLSRFPWNVFETMSPSLRSYYMSIGVPDEAAYDKIKHRRCTLCPSDHHNMPHREGHCPGANAGTASGIQRLGTEAASRVLARTLERASQTSEAAAQATATLRQAAVDVDAREGNTSATEALVYLLRAQDDEEGVWATRDCYELDVALVAAGYNASR